MYQLGSVKYWLDFIKANFFNQKDPILKEECHTNYKKYGNLLSPL